MSRQYGNLFLKSGGRVFSLEEERNAVSEGDIQEFIFAHPTLLPIDEIEPFFQPLIPVCRELGTPVGPADVMFVNERGLITLVECKLWRNPGARREVVGQILDYAKEISSWSYERLQTEVQRARGSRTQSLFELVSESSEELDESEFVDSVTANLRRGRFLLLIVGDGIRRSAERIGDFLHQHANLNFSLALVETKIFQVPQSQGGGFIFQPRVLARTVEIERAVFRIEDERIAAKPIVNEGESESASRRRTTISEQAFYEALDDDARVSRDLRALIANADELGLELEPGENSLKLKYYVEDRSFNFIVFYTTNIVRNFGIAAATDDMGRPEIGLEYLDALASFFEDAYVRKGKAGPFHWTIRHRNGDYVSIPEFLRKQDEWLALVGKTIKQIDSVLMQ